VTSTEGRSIGNDGYPIKMAEVMSQLDGVAYSVRVAVNNPKNIRQAGKAINKAFGLQVEKSQFAFVEVLASCPTNWAMDSLEANQRVADEMIPYFPLGTYKNIQD
jgi:2-oxoglutarate ferredoxin oxidoreductase subunit beta